MRRMFVLAMAAFYAIASASAQNSIEEKVDSLLSLMTLVFIADL